MDGLSALLLIGAAAGLYFWNQIHAAGNLQYKPGNVTGIDFSLTNTVATVDLIVQNTSNVDFTINSLAANAYTDGTLVGNVSDFMPVMIAGNSQGAIPLIIELYNISLVDQIISAFQNKFQKKELKLEGTVNANGFQTPFQLIYTVGL